MRTNDMVPTSAERRQAEELAVQVLGHIAADKRLSKELLAESGVQADDLRRAVLNPEFATFVLDFIVQDDRRVVEFSRQAGIRPEAVLRARTLLEGPGSDAWTAD